MAAKPAWPSIRAIAVVSGAIARYHQGVALFHLGIRQANGREWNWLTEDDDGQIRTVPEHPTLPVLGAVD
jgi:hypothetical protein